MHYTDYRRPLLLFIVVLLILWLWAMYGQNKAYGKPPHVPRPPVAPEEIDDRPRPPAPDVVPDPVRPVSPVRPPRPKPKPRAPAVYQPAQRRSVVIPGTFSFVWNGREWVRVETRASPYRPVQYQQAAPMQYAQPYVSPAPLQRVGFGSFSQGTYGQRGAAFCPPGQT